MDRGPVEAKRKTVIKEKPFEINEVRVTNLPRKPRGSKGIHGPGSSGYQTDSTLGYHRWHNGTYKSKSLQVRFGPHPSWVPTKVSRRVLRQLLWTK